jgi:catalase
MVGPLRICGGDTPAPAPEEHGGFVSYAEKVSGTKVRVRADSFNDHYTQARLFYKSLSDPEQTHLIDALRFELGKVPRQNIRETTVANLAQVDANLAKSAATWIGVATPSGGKEADQTTSFKGTSVNTSPALSIENLQADSIATRKVAVLVADGVSATDVNTVKTALATQGAVTEVVAKTLGTVTADDDSSVAVDRSAITVDSVLYDAVYVPGGAKSADALSGMAKALYFVAEAYAHYKPLAASGDGVAVLKQANLAKANLAGEGADGVVSDLGVVTTAGAADAADFTTKFVAAIGQHRFWDRPDQDQVPRV